MTPLLYTLLTLYLVMNAGITGYSYRRQQDESDMDDETLLGKSVFVFVLIFFGIPFFALAYTLRWLRKMKKRIKNR